MPSSRPLERQKQNMHDVSLHVSRVSESYPVHSATSISSPVDYYEKAAEHYDLAADEYRCAAGRYNYGDYQQSHEHVRSGKHHSQLADKYCARAAQES